MVVIQERLYMYGSGRCVHDMECGWDAWTDLKGARTICGYCHIQRQRIQAAEHSEVHNMSAVGLHANGCSTQKSMRMLRWSDMEMDAGA